MIPTSLALLELNWSDWATPFTPKWAVETTCSALVGATCGLLGCFVVLRRMALIGDALSHAVLPGVAMAFWLTRSDSILVLSLGALAAGLLAAVFINLVSQHSRTKEDSAIGIVFTAMFALGIIVVSAFSSGTHFDLKCFLFGDPLAPGTADLLLLLVVATVAFGAVGLLFHRFKLVSFDPVVAAAMGISVVGMHYLLMGLLSATIVAGLKSTGVILVVAMLITPASAAYQLTDRFHIMLGLSVAFGAASGLAGMSVAWVANAPTGPAMVLVASAIFLVSMILSPAHGVVFDRLRRRRLARHLASEDVLKAIHSLPVPSPGHVQDDIPAIAARAGMSQPATTAAVGRLRHAGLVTTDPTRVALTSAGVARAEEMIRSHRLWESYLAGEAKLPPEQVHDLADRLEHAHELADELDASLGYPATDPHGSPIPARPPRDEA